MPGQPLLPRNRRTAAALWAAGAVLSLAPPLRAQYASELVPFTLGVSAGWVSPEGVFSTRVPTGYHLDLALGYEPRHLPLGARFDAMYNGFVARGNYISTVPPATSGIAGVWGVTGDLVVGHPSGRGVHPYALGGVGIYGRSVELWHSVAKPAVINDPTLGFVNVITTTQMTRITDTENAGGWNAGVGVAFGIYPADLFIEARYHQIETAVQRTEIVPVTIGFRF